MYAYLIIHTQIKLFNVLSDYPSNIVNMNIIRKAAFHYPTEGEGISGQKYHNLLQFVTLQGGS